MTASERQVPMEGPRSVPPAAARNGASPAPGPRPAPTRGAAGGVGHGVDRQTLELLPDPTVVVAGDGTVAYANRLAARLVGRPQEQLAGLPAAEAFPLADEVGNDWWTCAHPLTGDARFAVRIPEVDLRLTAVDGRRRPLTLTGARVAAPSGVALLVLSLRRAERRERMDASRSELVSTVSHELRSPLTSVRGFTRTLLAKWGRFSDEQRQQMLRTMDTDAERVTRLLSELLDVSRIDARQLRLRRRMVTVPDVVDRVLARFAVVCGDRSLVSAFPPDLPALYADPDKVEQVFTNLVENAVHHGAGCVSVSAAVADTEVVFTVADEGRGIPESARPHAFAKFGRAGATRTAGTGLGLYITKGIVEAHGGRIWVHGDEGAGARFSFTLPRGGLELAGVPPEVRTAVAPPAGKVQS